ncbi:hypothetical protein F2Q68_00038700 [Brassica cretica]|uniref:Uncharacterized protein n=1 Tax=Brassica cretica TaxID=69181 RepID=A0A8S9MBZ2_BRACR|nr:hypothetical protein F2Q68_00038700 [Brassica cretica]
MKSDSSNKSGRMELAETGGSFSREELILVEVVPSPDLRREYSETERFRVGFLGFGVIRFSLFGSLRCSSSWSDSAGSCHGWARGGFLRVGEIPVPIRRYQECSGTVLVLEARLTADVIVVKVSCSIPHVVSSQGIGPLVLKGHGCAGGARESFAVSESASRQCSHPGAVVFYGGVSLMAEASAYLFWESVQASCGASFIPALVALARHCYSGNVKGTPDIRENEENLTFPRIMLMVENDYRYRMTSKNNLAERAGFSGWAKLGL